GGVGGTVLSVRTGGGYLRETAWEDVVENAGGGGGLSPQDPLPPWQVGPAVQEAGISNGNRQIPDVAAAADNDSGFSTVFTDPDSGDRVNVPIGGTSAAAPFWAAS